MTDSRLALSLLARVVLLCTMTLLPSWIAANELHPEFPLLDNDGQAILHTGQPLSAMNTCGACHDTDFIRDSSDHYAAGVFEGKSIDCLACHTDANKSQQWSAGQFQEDGSLKPGVLPIRKPMDENCASCHGLISNDLDNPLVITGAAEDRAMTERTGQIISPQKISNSGLNIAGKNDLVHPFDVHADRVVGCVNCHYSLNNPVYFQQRAESRPAHLAFDPRRLTSSDYLTRPSHQLAKGSSRHGLDAVESINSMRRCESCHDAEAVHEWLPYRRRHFSALACETCHIPRLYGPALELLDESIVDASGSVQRHYRAVEGDPTLADSLIHGFEPLVMSRESVGGEPKLAPWNLYSHLSWEAGPDGGALTPEQLHRAFYHQGRLRQQLQQALDQDDSGTVSIDELRFATPEAVGAGEALLQAAGHENPRLVSQVQAWPMSHGVVNGRWATRECRQCHEDQSILGAPMSVGGFLAGGTLPDFPDGLSNGQLSAIEGGGAVFTPNPSSQGYYVLGHSRIAWVDWLGLTLFLGVTMGVAVHGLARWYSNRRRRAATQTTERVRMYDAYERIWHWLQAGAIMLLLFTGLVIHKPEFFGILSFPWIVQLHTVLGFILLVNAALALFYTLASGTIRRFFPDPDGFFIRAFEQAMYYSKGVFAGADHPMHKSRQQRLNPLQQVTYLAILNILLPAQVVTGVLIWGLQEWPQLGAALGGLPLLAPAHTLLAWVFAAFIVMHVYLTTHGATPLEGIKAMVTGWEEIERENETLTEKIHGQ